jgi:hypothetical protein
MTKATDKVHRTNNAPTGIREEMKEISEPMRKDSQASRIAKPDLIPLTSTPETQSCVKGHRTTTRNHGFSFFQKGPEKSHSKHLPACRTAASNTFLAIEN